MKGTTVSPEVFAAVTKVRDEFGSQAAALEQLLRAGLGMKPELTPVRPEEVDVFTSKNLDAFRNAVALLNARLKADKWKASTNVLPSAVASAVAAMYAACGWVVRKCEDGSVSVKHPASPY